MQKTRIVDYFISLVEIDSESKDELALARKLKDDLESMGAEVIFDNANKQTGGNVGNMIAKIPGSIEKSPLLFCAHLDTVIPGKGVKPVIRDNRIFSDGTTILGADDKSGIAEVIEAIRRLGEEGITHAPIELVFTVSEEIGLLGAKHLDFSPLKAKIGYALDSDKIGSITTRAPALNLFNIMVHGRESHAGVFPEKGINAIKVASDAISQIETGRYDKETTVNIGEIQGGIAHNIVPSKVTIKGEVRSHNEDKLNKVTNGIITTFENVAKKYRVKNEFGMHAAKVEADVKKDFSAVKIDEESEVVQIALDAANKLKLKPELEMGGGGSDANIFNSNNIDMPILGTGMNNFHSLTESISIDDLEAGTAWLMEIIKNYSKK
jgi:tripeptide aminopeptidase